MKNITFTLLAAVILLPLLTGCVALVAGGAAGAGTLAYVRGELKEELSVSPEVARSAITSATNRLGLRELESNADNLTGEYVLETGDDKKVKIYYEKLSDALVKLTIRVGVFGDENLSRAILDEIKKGL